MNTYPLNGRGQEPSSTYSVVNITYPVLGECSHNSVRNSRKYPSCVHNQAQSLISRLYDPTKSNNTIYRYPPINKYPGPTHKLILATIQNPNSIEVIGALCSSTSQALGNVGIFLDCIVKEEFRHLGIGRTLFEESEKQYPDNGVIFSTP